MIKKEEIKKLVDGEIDGQIITVIVQAPSQIVPSVVLNVYLNLNMKFITMQSSIVQPKTNLTMTQQKPSIITTFIFSTTLKSYKKVFGPYHPAKVLNFNFIGNEGGIE